ncbi:hypothetical protein [Ghiorsea bivora]|uniref:hypothetical protein n=1 Tax=Ghiorsea bivora TaxID=1485545 RepID=UPI000571B048|nr:hypothetical protein [Ghiorsea bivora]
MKSFIKSLPYPLLFIMAVFMAFAPFQAEPHLVQKFDMFMAGKLSKPLDIFDLFWHLLPMILLVTKFFLSQKEK